MDVEILSKKLKQLENMKHDAIYDEVADVAVSLHGTLSSLGAKYSRDIIPDMTTVLNKLDAALKVNEDLKQAFTDLSN